MFLLTNNCYVLPTYGSVLLYFSSLFKYFFQLSSVSLAPWYDISLFYLFQRVLKNGDIICIFYCIAWWFKQCVYWHFIFNFYLVADCFVHRIICKCCSASISFCLYYSAESIWHISIIYECSHIVWNISSWKAITLLVFFLERPCIGEVWIWMASTYLQFWLHLLFSLLFGWRIFV